MSNLNNILTIGETLKYVVYAIMILIFITLWKLSTVTDRLNDILKELKEIRKSQDIDKAVSARVNTLERNKDDGSKEVVSSSKNNTTTNNSDVNEVMKEEVKKEPVPNKLVTKNGEVDVDSFFKKN